MDSKTTNQEQVEAKLGEALHKSPLGIFHTMDLLLQALHVSRHGCFQGKSLIPTPLLIRETLFIIPIWHMTLTSLLIHNLMSQLQRCHEVDMIPLANTYWILIVGQLREALVYIVSSGFKLTTTRYLDKKMHCDTM